MKRFIEASSVNALIDIYDVQEFCVKNDIDINDRTNPQLADFVRDVVNPGMVESDLPEFDISFIHDEITPIVEYLSEGEHQRYELRVTQKQLLEGLTERQVDLAISYNAHIVIALEGK